VFTMSRLLSLLFVVSCSVSTQSALFPWGRSDIPGWIYELRQAPDVDTSVRASDVQPRYLHEEEEEDIDSSLVLLHILEQMKNRMKRMSISKRSAVDPTKLYNVEMLRKLSGGLFDMSYLKRDDQ